MLNTGAVGMQQEVDEPLVLFRGREDQGSGAVSEENGVPSGPIDDVGERVRPDDQNVLVHARPDELGSRCNGEESAGTHSGDIKRGRVEGTQLLLDNARTGGDGPVRGGGGEDDEIDVRRGQPRILYRESTCFCGQVAGGFPGRDASLADAEFLLDPSITGPNGIEVGVVDDIGDFSSVRVEIERAIEEGGDIRDSASPSLRKLRQGVADSYNRLIQRLERISHSMDVSPSLQSDAVATRGDRLVLEVRSERRKSVPGIVHDVSNTGQTIFIEPMEVVELGNTWRETAAEVVREESRIFRRLSEHLGDVGREAVLAMKATAKLDMIMARGRLATSMTARRVECLLPTEVTAVELKDARHPLLGDDAVPATISVGPDFKCLVITGPNAGGKTVALKTVGLLALMNQAGLQIPASVESRIAAFESIHADIGDAQSIERSVSTFSSHMSAVVDILKTAGPRSLVLLDELGTGTDPDEGSALARAIVEELSQRRIPAVITTHHRGVADFATGHDGTENASMELSPDTMLPTYHLAMGLPGRSYAIAVAIPRLTVDAMFPTSVSR